MIIGLTILFIPCVFIAGFVSKIFNLGDRATVGVMMWSFVLVVGIWCFH